MLLAPRALVDAHECIAAHGAVGAVNLIIGGRAALNSRHALIMGCARGFFSRLWRRLLTS